MTYIKWKDEVESYLMGLSEEEKKKVFSYFSEMYADKRDAGKSEEQIIEEFGAPYDVALKILSDSRESAGTTAAPKTPSTPPPVYSQPTYSQPVYSQPTYSQPDPTPPKAKKYKLRRRLTGGKGWLIALCIAVSLLILSLIFFLVDVARNDWKLSITYTVNEFTATEQNTRLDLSLAAGKMDLVYHDGESIEISYPTSNRFRYVVKETNGTLSVKPKSSYYFFMFGTGTIPTVTVKVPRSQALELDFHIAAGDATISDMSFTSVDITVSAGNLTAGKVTCDNFDAHISAGNVSFSGVTCNTTSFFISAGEATVGNLACDKITAKVSAGTVSLIVAGEEDDYNIKVSKSAGKCNVTEQTVIDSDKLIDLKISAGTVTVNFTE